MSAVVLRDPAHRRMLVLHVERATPNVLVHGFRGPAGPTGGTGEPGPQGQNFQLAGSAPTYADLPTLTEDAAGAAWLTNADGRVYVWSGSAWPAQGDAPVLQGPAGTDGADGAPGQVRFTGHGPPPAVIVGANPRDTYMDLDDGTLYKLA